MIDITMNLERDHNVWKWLESQENKLMNVGHVGTHIDVYKKSKVPVDYFKTRGVLIDCTEYGIEKEIGMEVIEGIDIKYGEKVFIVFKTGIQSRFEYGSEMYTNNHPQLGWELIDFLLQRQVCFIGIDCAGIRRGSEHIKADIKAEGNRTYVIENLDMGGLNLKNGDKFDVYTMWIENPFATGLSTRVLADVI